MKLGSGVICVLVLALGAACGGPDASVTDTSSPDAAGDLVAFCDQSEKLDAVALRRHPNDSELDRYVETAPPDIKGDAEILAASAREFRAGDEEAASSDEIQAAGNRVDAYVQENCEDD